MKWTWKYDGLSLALIAGMVVAAVMVWPTAPDSVPVHWNIAGQPDRYGSRAEGLLMLPAITLVMFLLLRFAPKLDPRGEHYETMAGAYDVLRTAVITVMAGIDAVALAWVSGHPVDMGRWMCLMIGGLFVVLGNYLPKVRSNWLMGVRTPWTLSSEEAWYRTHRLAGKLFMLTGMLTAVMGLWQPSWGFWTLMGLLALTVTVTLVYSYVIWRRDPNRLQA